MQAADVVDVAVNEGDEGFSVDVTLDDAASRIQDATRDSIAGADMDDAASRIQEATRDSIAGVDTGNSEAEPAAEEPAAEEPP